MNGKDSSRRDLWRLLATSLLVAVSFAGAINTARFTVTNSSTPLPQNSTGNQTITVTNAGPDTGTGVVATYKPPTTAGISVNSVTASPGGACTFSASLYTCPSVPNVLINSSVTLTVNMTVSDSVPVGTSAGSTVKVNSAEFNPGSGTGESLFSTWGATGVSGAAGDAFWFAFDGNYADTGYKSETGSTGTTPLTTDWPVARANPRGTYSIKRDDETYNQSDNPADNAAPNSQSHPLPYNAFGTANSTIQPPKNQSVVTAPPTVNLPQPGTLKSQNNRRVWEVRTGIYLNTAQNLYVCVSQPDDAMYVAIDPATSGTIAASASTYNSGVVNSGGTALPAGYHEVVYRIFNRNNQANSFESGVGGFGALGMGTAVSTSGTTTEQCSSSNYNNFTQIGPASNVTVGSPVSDLAIDKSGPAAIGSSGSMSYTVRVWNNGPSITTGVGVNDTIPGGFTVTGITCAANGSAVCGTQTSTNSSIAVTTGNLTIDSVPGNSTPDGNFLTYTITGTAPANGSISNTASLTVPAGTTDSVTGNNSTAASPVVTRVIDAVNDAAVSYAFGSGGTVSVLGNDTNGGVVATTATSTVSISNPGGLTGLTVNGSGQLVVPSAAAPGSYTVTYSLCDKTVTTACDTATVQVTVGAGSLAIAKSFSPTTVVSGGTVTLTLTVTNPNPTLVSALSVTDNVAATMGLPAPLVLRTTANTCGGTPSAANNNSGTYTLTGGSVAASSSCIVTIALTVSNATAGSKTNTIPAANVTGTVGGTSVTAVASASASLTVTASNAGGTVTCDANFYQLRQDPTTLLSNLYRLDPAVPDSGGIALWSSGFGPALNALGYNVKDGYFYAVNITPLSSGDPYRLYRMGAGSAVEYAPLTGIPGGGSIAAGTVNRDGVMYIKKQQQDSVIYQYDIASKTLRSSLTVANVQIFDLAINPVNNLLYGVVAPGVLYQIDPVNGSTTTFGTLPTVTNTNAIGSAFFNAAGTLYAYQNGGVFGTIDLTTGAFTQTGTPGSATQSDGASCPFGPPPSITLLKLGRNIGPSPVLTTGQLPPANTTAAFVDGSVVIGAKPGDRVEYCIVYTNTGGLAPNFVLTDNVPIVMDALLNAYGPGGEPVATQKGIYWANGQVLTANATAVPNGGVNLTSVSDADKGTLTTAGGLGKGTMTLNLGPAPAGLAAGGQGTVCFQARVP